MVNAKFILKSRFKDDQVYCNSDRDYEAFLIKSSLFDELRFLHFHSCVDSRPPFPHEAGSILPLPLKLFRFKLSEQITEKQTLSIVCYAEKPLKPTQYTKIQFPEL